MASDLALLSAHAHAQDKGADDSYLGRARSMTKTLENKGKHAALTPTGSANSEFARIVERLKSLQSSWTERRLTRKVPVIHLKHGKAPACEAEKEKESGDSEWRAEKQAMTATLSSLFGEMQQLKQQNHGMSLEMSTLRKVLTAIFCCICCWFDTMSPNRSS